MDTIKDMQFKVCVYFLDKVLGVEGDGDVKKPRNWFFCAAKILS